MSTEEEGPRHKLVPLTKEEDELVKATRGPACKDLASLVRTEPPTVTVPACFSRLQDHLKNMQVREDDVWILTPPKCGTTWTQEMTWLAMHQADVETALEINLFERTNFLDFAMLLMSSQEEVDGMFAKVESLPSPRLFKSHLPFELLPDKLLDTCKVIFVCRNVKDAAVSFYYHEKLFKIHDLLLDDFERYAKELYKPGLVFEGDYFNMLRSGWSRSKHPNMMLLWYEKMKKDQKQAIRDIAKHIGYSLTEDQLDRIDDYCRFENMSKTCPMNKPLPMFHENRGSFLRKGKVGDWTSHFSTELAQEWDQWATEELDKIGVEDKEIRSYFGL